MCDSIFLRHRGQSQASHTYSGNTHHLLRRRYSAAPDSNRIRRQYAKLVHYRFRGTASATAPTPSTAAAGATTYYVSQVNPATGCESERGCYRSERQCKSSHQFFHQHQSIQVWYGGWFHHTEWLKCQYNLYG